MLPHLPGVPHLHVNRLLDWQNNNSARASHFFILYISLPFMEDVNSRQRTFFFFSWSSIQTFRIQSTLEKIAKIWRIERDGKSEILFKAARLHFLVIFVTVAVVILKDLTKLQRRRRQEVKKAKGIMCITFFIKFLCRPCTTTTWNDQILTLLENGNGKAINSTISVWTRARSVLLSSNLASLLLSNCST